MRGIGGIVNLMDHLDIEDLEDLANHLEDQLNLDELTAQERREISIDLRNLRARIKKSLA